MLTLLREGCVEAAAHWQLLQKKKKKNFLDWISFQMFWFFCKNRYTAWCLPYLYMPFGATWHLPVPVKAVEFVWVFLGSLLLGEDEGFFWFVEMVFFQLFFWLLFFFPHCQLFCFFFWETGEGFFFFLAACFRPFQFFIFLYNPK